MWGQGGVNWARADKISLLAGRELGYASILVLKSMLQLEGWSGTILLVIKPPPETSLELIARTAISYQLVLSPLQVLCQQITLRLTWCSNLQCIALLLMSWVKSEIQLVIMFDKRQRPTLHGTPWVHIRVQPLVGPVQTIYGCDDTHRHT